MFKNPEYTSLKVIFFVVVAVGVGYFAFNSAHKNSLNNTGQVIDIAQKSANTPEASSVYFSTAVGRIIDTDSSSPKIDPNGTSRVGSVSSSGSTTGNAQQATSSTGCKPTDPPSVHVVYPSAGSIFNLGSYNPLANLSIRWTECNINIPQRLVTVTLLDMNSLSVVNDTSPMPDTGGYMWPLPPIYPENAYYKVAVTIWTSSGGFTGLYGISPYFTIKNTQPKVWLDGAHFAVVNGGGFTNPFTISSTSICANGIYGADTSNPLLTTWFEYGLTNAFGTSTPHILQSTASGVSSQCMTGLTSNTNYYIRFVGQNSGGVYYSQGYAIVHTL